MKSEAVDYLGKARTVLPVLGGLPPLKFLMLRRVKRILPSSMPSNQAFPLSIVIRLAPNYGKRICKMPKANTVV
jgi:hypothetical protein